MGVNFVGIVIQVRNYRDAIFSGPEDPGPGDPGTRTRIGIRGVGNEQFWRTRFPDFSLISSWFLSKMTSYVVKVGGAGGLGWFPTLISRKSALISHDFNLISTDFSTKCTRFLSLPTPRWHTLHVYIHSTYIVHVSLIARLECTMEQRNFVYSRWHLCSSCFCPFPL